MDKPPKYHRMHYNLVAKVLREQLAPYLPSMKNTSDSATTRRVQIGEIAAAFAERFQRDNPEGFDAEAFMDQCSPDIKQYRFIHRWRMKQENTST